MKPSSAFFAASLAANGVLLATFIAQPMLAPAFLRERLSPGTSAESPRAGDPRAALAAQSESAPRKAVATGALRKSPDDSTLWAALNDDDLRVLVARLRSAGFSRAVIRSIVNARLQERFEARARELMAPFEDAPFWKPDPLGGPGAMSFFEQYSQLYRERSRMLRDLLGADAQFGAGGDAGPRRQYGNLSPAKMDLVQRINDDYAEMSAQIRAAGQGIILPEDRDKLALLERERRADLAAALTPEELAELDLRSSPVTSRLRNALTIMDATEQEFRAIFRIVQASSDPAASAGGRASTLSRPERQQQEAAQLKAVLGETRYADYARATNPEFQQLHRIARVENVPLDATVRAFELRDSAARESQRIMADLTLDAPARRSALMLLGQRSRAQLLGTLGPIAGANYANSARWLGYLEKGGAVSINPQGTVSYGPLPPTRP